MRNIPALYYYSKQRDTRCKENYLYIKNNSVCCVERNVCRVLYITISTTFR